MSDIASVISSGHVEQHTRNEPLIHDDRSTHHDYAKHGFWFTIILLFIVFACICVNVCISIKAREDEKKKIQQQEIERQNKKIASTNPFDDYTDDELLPDDV
mmetsp:Transcript_56931/g.51221  ORF Transcript_56931/g.51221 Transcript_56931/m.51221 type:complete len:102 (+) Transcript_56931:28-333(+)